MYCDKDFQRFEVHPLTGALGAEVRGLDLASGLSDAAKDDLLRAANRYYVLAVRGQTLDLQGFHDLREALGAFSGNPVHIPVEGFDDIILLQREPDETGKVIGEDWHMDLAWLAVPPGLTMLYGKVVPPIGGDTMFASLELAYKGLSASMREFLDGLVGVHNAGSVLAAQYGTVKVRPDAAKIEHQEVEHPLVCANPATGRRYLFVSSVLKKFKGFTEAESRPIIDFLLKAATRPEFTCRLRWEPGTVGMWLNPCVLHTAINDYSGSRRVMYRTTIQGWQPRAAAPDAHGGSGHRVA
jgi:alpha-ketoglutarate-dependent taurine dioxygenase